ncbi:MAG: methyltransferase domain-containing protein [Gammaproteobacteria bacterium]
MVLVIPDEIRRALVSPRRSDDDRRRDEPRHIGALLAFFGIGPGMRVADLMASRGYLAGTLAEVVGETGQVYAQNSPRMVARFKGADPVAQRIAEHGLTNVVSIICELEDLRLPAGSLDTVFSFMFYHDTVWVGTDRAAMNASVFSALKPGGIFAVIDHHAPAGTGVSLAEAKHRIERRVVVDEVTAAGFTLADETDILENPDDPLDVLVFDKTVRDRTHKFALKFQKPA